MSYDPVSITTKSAVPLCAQSMSATVHSARCDVQGLTAHWVLLQLARLAVLWVGG